MTNIEQSSEVLPGWWQKYTDSIDELLSGLNDLVSTCDDHRLPAVLDIAMRLQFQMKLLITKIIKNEPNRLFLLDLPRTYIEMIDLMIDRIRQRYLISDQEMLLKEKVFGYPVQDQKLMLRLYAKHADGEISIDQLTDAVKKMWDNFVLEYCIKHYNKQDAIVTDEERHLVSVSVEKGHQKQLAPGCDLQGIFLKPEYYECCIYLLKHYDVIDAKGATILKAKGHGYLHAIMNAIKVNSTPALLTKAHTDQMLVNVFSAFLKVKVSDIKRVKSPTSQDYSVMYFEKEQEAKDLLRAYLKGQQ